MSHIGYFHYFTLVELVCHQRRVDTSGSRSLCTILVYRLPGDFVSFPCSSSYRLNQSYLLCGAVSAIFFMCDHHQILFLFAIRSVGCMLPYTCVVPCLFHSSVSCRFSETTHICCGQYLPFVADEGPVFTL